MNQNHNLPDNQYTEDEIDLRELFEVLWSKKRLIIIFTAIASFIALIYSLSLPNIYTSKALLAPTMQRENINDTLSRYGGLASLAGINLPSTSTSNVTEAIEMLSSFAFFKNSILPNIFLPDLIAVKSWDAKTNTISYNNDLYDLTNNKWVGGVKSDQFAFNVFKGHFSINQDPTTGFVTIYTKHQSPDVAKAWLDNIFSGVNQTLREDQKKRSLLSIEYLNKQIANTSYTEIKQGLSALIQQETEKLMLIEANKDYVFKAIDPPIIPELKSAPNRTLILLVGTLLGGILGILIALVRHYLLENN